MCFCCYALAACDSIRVEDAGSGGVHSCFALGGKFVAFVSRSKQEVRNSCFIFLPGVMKFRFFAGVKRARINNFRLPVETDLRTETFSGRCGDKKLNFFFCFLLNQMFSDSNKENNLFYFLFL